MKKRYIFAMALASVMSLGIIAQEQSEQEFLEEGALVFEISQKKEEYPELAPQLEEFERKVRGPQHEVDEALWQKIQQGAEQINEEREAAGVK